MAYKVLVADDDDGQCQSHSFALEEAASIIGETVEIVLAKDSVEARQKLMSEAFSLAIIDNDFGDQKVKGHLPGIALMQLARKSGPNVGTPMVFCTANAYDGLTSMVEKYNGIYLPKSKYDLEKVAAMFAEQLKKDKR
ncbi:MAG: hypothetical protein ACE5H0_01430 [Bacteroidota bacterium]